MKNTFVPRLSDIAKEAGVSTAAVSIALNKPQTTRVSAEKRKKIIAIAEEMGYYPNELAKALAERRTRLIGLVAPLGDPIFFNRFIAQSLSGIQNTLMRRGYNLLVFSPTGKRGRTTRDQIFESRFTDGLILINTRTSTANDAEQAIAELQAAQIKFVMMNSYYGNAPINYVGVDDASIGTAAAEYLMNRGHTRIAFLSGSPTLETHRYLAKGLRRGLASRGLKLGPERVGCTQYDMEKAYAILDQWFRVKRDRPTAIFTSDDQVLLYLYDYAEEHGITLPHDLAVLSRCNSLSDDHLRPKPTMIGIPTFRMGELAADLLIDSIERPDIRAQQILLPYELIPGTTA